MQVLKTYQIYVGLFIASKFQNVQRTVLNGKQLWIQFPTLQTRFYSFIFAFYHHLVNYGL